MSWIHYSAGAFALVFLASFLALTEASGDVTTFEANIFAPKEDIIRVSVPDYIFIGNVTKGGKSAELKVYVNNTGSVNINVKPQLANKDEAIFNYLYFRSQKTKIINGISTEVPYEKIGNFSFNISKPSSGNNFNDEYFYVILDLTNYSENPNQDLIGYKADVKFFAIAN